MDNNEHQLKEIQWKFIADKIRNEQCVLVLGPEIFTALDAQKSCSEALVDYLDIPNNPNIHRHYPEDEFFLFDESYKRTLVCHQIKSFYDTQRPNAMLADLAQVPFHIYLTVTPDSLLQQSFDAQNFSYQSGYYKRKKDQLVIKTPGQKNPLIYNLFGSVESEESIILSHDDLFDYFKSIFAEQSVPEKLKIELQEVKNFIFLGIPFDKWYMHLLLRELEIHNRRYEFTRYAAGQIVTEQLTSFCLDQFQIQFVSQNISGFISELKKQFSGAELRQSEEGAMEALAKARRLLGKGSIQAAIEELEDYLEDTTLQNEITQLSGRYGKFNRRVLKGILREEEKITQENNLMNDALSIIDLAEKQGI